MQDSFQCQSTITINQKSYSYFSLPILSKKHSIGHLPFCLKILLENILRNENNDTVTKSQIESLLNWDPKAPATHEIAFTPARVLLQDFTGVPAIVDLAAMREAILKLDGSASQINPLCPVELVIDHSIMVDHFGTPSAFQKNTTLEFKRNQERYQFLVWGQKAFNNFKVVPPGTGIVHQVNLEYLARVVFEKTINNNQTLYPDTVVGTDSHTTMINSLGILGWGVGGIEAEAALLGQPLTMLIPQVIGFELTGKLKKSATATDLVLTIVETLRKKGVVGKFVEFFGTGLSALPVADRATLSNMAPEYGATCGIFPIDNQTLEYLRLTGRTQEQINRVETYAKAQALFQGPNTKTATYSDMLQLNLSTIEPTIAGPKRPQDKILLTKAKSSFIDLLKIQKQISTPQKSNIMIENQSVTLKDGDIVIAAITSCTNTSNPSVMIGAGLLAQKAYYFGLRTKPWVKTSLAPGSQVVTEYLDKANLTMSLEKLGFSLVGYGCTTCIGNSGPLFEPIEHTIINEKLIASAVLSGNRNFEGRIHPLVKNTYLVSPPLVIAYALAGTMNIDFSSEPIGKTPEGIAIYLDDIWPSHEAIQKVVQQSIDSSLFQKRYQDVFKGDNNWQNFKTSKTDCYDWDKNSTYIQHPPFFENMSKRPKPIQSIQNARVLVKLADSITTDHISPAGSIAKTEPAGDYLLKNNIKLYDFNSYGSRRGNHHVMMRGTFANIRLKNELMPNSEGSQTCYFPTNQPCSIYDAAVLYKKEKIPLIVLAGKEYGSGSSRDWAAKGPRLLGIQVVIAESFERIHRSNLIGMGILALTFLHNENSHILKLNGTEMFNFDLSELEPKSHVTVTTEDPSSKEKKTFQTLAQIQTPKEFEYYQHGGILQYVLRNLTQNKI